MKSVVICGSARFRKEVHAFAEKLREKGVLVFVPKLSTIEWEKLSKEAQIDVAKGLTHDHFYKIRMADVVFIFNKDGYSGNSTTLEVGYAAACDKPIYALHEDEEICRMVLFQDIIKTPSALVKVLK